MLSFTCNSCEGKIRVEYVSFTGIDEEPDGALEEKIGIYCPNCSSFNDWTEIDNVRT